MKRFFLLLIFFLIFSNLSKAYVKLGSDCASLVKQLGGLNKVDILWLENHNEKKYQYALINLSKKSTNRSFYLCGNKHNINSTSDKTMNVLSERNIQLISKDPVDLFSEIFSLTSTGSRKYIMQRLNINDFLFGSIAPLIYCNNFNLLINRTKSFKYKFSIFCIFDNTIYFYIYNFRTLIFNHTLNFV